MRMGRRVMALRVIGLSCGLLLAATLGLGEARAGGRGGAMAVAPHPTAAAPAHHPQSRPVWNAARWRQAAGPGFRHGVHRRWGWSGLGYADPWLFYPQAENSTIAVIERPVELSQPIDLDSFENLPARAGIRRGPAPEPTIYRLEGPRLRPAARVIRIGAAESQGSRRTRFAHAETGALLLTVPGR